MHVDRTISAAPGGVSEHVVSELEMTVVVNHAFGITNFHFQRRQGHERLERQSDRIRSREAHGS